MGRDSGFIAAHAALSIQEVNFVIIPEMKFDLYGHNGFLTHLKKRIEQKHHAVIVVAEGAGQFLFENAEVKMDASGNKIHNDIGVYLKEKINEEFCRRKMEFTIKYIDPSYIIRSAPAIASDSRFCNQLAQYAVHAAMAGRTGFVVGNWADEFTILPISLATETRKKIQPDSELLFSLLCSTGQPMIMTND
jgi:6-phosphofructokinase 1